MSRVILLAILSSFLHLQFARAIFSPKPVYPNEHTTWFTGEWHTVQWDTRGVDPSTVDRFCHSEVWLMNQDPGSDGSYLVLRDNFDILSGKVDVFVPLRGVETGTQYAIYLIGDGGNPQRTAEFVIKQRCQPPNNY